MEEVNKADEPQEKDDKKIIQEIEAETAAWIKTDPKVQEYLSHFRAIDVGNFMKNYPSVKARFMHYGSTLGDLPEQMQEGYIEDAEDRLMDIQRKKLFDLICQWDAELIKFDDIQISYDFLKWDDDIENCPYLTPISTKEFDLYMQFASSSAFDKDVEITMNNYDDYRDEEEEFEEIPAWFKFEDMHTGHGKYKDLPQLRSEKEAAYISLWHKEKNEEINKKYETGELKKYVPDDRPDISICYYSHIEKFIIANETNKEVLQLFRKHYAYFSEQLIRDNEEDNEDGWLTEQTESIIHQLSGIKEKIAVEANDDWRVALIEGFAAYEKNKVLQALPYAYEDYLMRKQLGITRSHEEKRRQELDRNITKIVRDQILRGRELSGQSRDFNF